MPDEVKLMLEFRVDDSVDTSGTQDAAENAGTEIGISKPGAKKMRKLHLSYYSLSKPCAKFHRAAQAQEEAKYNKIMPNRIRLPAKIPSYMYCLWLVSCLILLSRNCLGSSFCLSNSTKLALYQCIVRLYLYYMAAFVKHSGLSGRYKNNSMYIFSVCVILSFTTSSVLSPREGS